MQRFEDRLKILSQTDKPKQAAEQRWLEAERDVRMAKVTLVDNAGYFSEGTGQAGGRKGI